jgi:hypothetical protein
MATQTKFTLYDLVVDLIPGIVAILLIVWIFESGGLSEIVEKYGSALPVLVLLAVGYVVGRIVHSLSNADIIENISIFVYNMIPRVNRVEYKDRKFANRIAYVKRNSDSDSLERAVVTKAEKSIYDHFEVETIEELDEQYPDPTDEDKFRGPVGEIPDLRYGRYLSDVLVYQNQNLSWKYGILATFFRNMWFIFALSAALYLLSGVPWVDIRTGVIFAGLSVSSLICIHQRFKFKRRQIRTMINEVALLQE